MRQLEYLLSLGRINDEFDYEGLVVVVHISKDQYLKWAGLSWGEFEAGRKKMRIKFEFTGL